MPTMRYVFASHDGFGLGHVRRNARLAAALRRSDPGAEIAIVTGIESRHDWLDGAGFEVVRVPSLVKDASGNYRNRTVDTPTALAEREAVFASTIRRLEPDAVVIDRHPLGISGELRTGIVAARRLGAQIIVGLRDVIDEAAVVKREFAGPQWADAAGLVDQVLVYGARHVCDHVYEYGLPLAPTYCGWVSDPAPQRCEPDPGLLVVTAGGGHDGADVVALGLALTAHPSLTRAQFVLGPAATDTVGLQDRAPEGACELEMISVTGDCGALYSAAGAVVQMAGYNSTVEALAAGARPILAPRRSPRREQAIRATRLSSLGLADVVDAHATAAEIGWLLDRPRRLTEAALVEAGFALDGAERAASIISDSMVGQRTALRAVSA